jgi:hypothetical protein
LTDADRARAPEVLEDFVRAIADRASVLLAAAELGRLQHVL